MKELTHLVFDFKVSEDCLERELKQLRQLKLEHYLLIDPIEFLAL
nr:MAG TPA: hypothetical protein [Bacteriophage sp.]DAW45149.1 MAG TPA: hypothetical protein [Bacteriophage sp.]